MAMGVTEVTTDRIIALKQGYMCDHYHQLAITIMVVATLTAGIILVEDGDFLE
jgi:hypothetical protein